MGDDRARDGAVGNFVLRHRAMDRFFGGSPASVILKLAIASLIIGVVLSFSGFNPYNLYDAIGRLVRWLSNLSLDAFQSVFRYLLLGALVVVPIWVIMRLFSVFGSDKSQQKRD